MSNTAPGARPHEAGIPERGHLVRAATAQRIGWIAGTEHTIMLDGIASTGQLAVFRSRFAPGTASPLHVHPDQDETLCVLEGHATIWVGEDRWDVGGGDTAFLPRGIPHTYLIGGEGADILTICTPSGMEEFFRIAGRNDPERSMSSSDIDANLLQLAADRTGQVILGPPFATGDVMPLDAIDYRPEH